MSASSTRVSTPKLPTSSSSTIKPSTSHAAYKLLSQAHPNDEETTNKIFTEKILHKPLLLSSTNDTNSRSARSARRHIRLRKKTYHLRHTRPKPLSAKEKRALKIYELRPEECHYEIYKDLNGLWTRYILEVLGYLDREGRIVTSRIGQPVAVSNGATLLASADFHGMEVEVVACVDQGRVGCKGIIVRETRSTLTVVCDEKEDSVRKLRPKVNRESTPSTLTTENKVGESHGIDPESSENNQDHTRHGNQADQKRDKVRMILKKGAVFRVTIDLPSKDEDETRPGETDTSMDDVQSSEANTNSKSSAPLPKRRVVFELHGDQFETRPIERAVKKYKWKPGDYL